MELNIIHVVVSPCDVSLFHSIASELSYKTLNLPQSVVNSIISIVCFRIFTGCLMQNRRRDSSGRGLEAKVYIEIDSPHLNGVFSGIISPLESASSILTIFGVAKSAIIPESVRAEHVEDSQREEFHFCLSMAVLCQAGKGRGRCHTGHPVFFI